MIRLFPVVAAVLVVGFAASRVQPTPAQLPHYLWVSLHDTGGQQRIDRSRADGYRVVTASDGLVLLERSFDTQSPEYVVLRPTKGTTFQDQINSIASRGFRLLPQTLFDTARGLGAVMQTCAAPEDAAELSCRFEYWIIVKVSTPTHRLEQELEQEIAQGADNGFRLVYLETFEYHGHPDDDPEFKHVAVLERPLSAGSRVADAGLPGDRLRLLPTDEPRALQQALNEHATRGYRLGFASSAFIVLEKASPLDVSPDYLVVGPAASSRFQGHLNDAASRGYRLSSRPLFAGPSGWKGLGFGAVMEKPPEPGPQPQYRVIGAYRWSTLDKEFALLVAQGYTVAAMIGIPRETCIVFRR